MSSLSFIEALDQALQLLEQGQPLEQCLQQFPEYADELRPLLMVSDDLRRLANTSPTTTKPLTQPNWEQLLHDVPQQPRWIGPWIMMFRRVQRTARGSMLHSSFMMAGRYAVVAVLSIGLTWGTYNKAMASTERSPILYAFKETSQNIQLIAASFDPVRQNEVYQQILASRINELTAITEDKGQLSETLLDRITESAEQVKQSATEISDPEQKKDAQEALAEATESLEALAAKVPEDMQEKIAATSFQVAGIQAELQDKTPEQVAAAKPDPSPTAGPPAATPTPTQNDVPVQTKTPVTPTPVPTKPPYEPTTPTATSVPTDELEAPTPTPVVAVPPIEPTQVVPTLVPVQPTLVPTPTATPVPSEEPTVTPVPPTDTPTNTPEPIVETSTPELSPTPVPSPTETATPSPEPSLPPTATVTATVTVTPITPPWPSATPTTASTVSPSDTPVPSPSDTTQPTATLVPTAFPSVPPIVPPQAPTPAPSNMPVVPVPFVSPAPLPTAPVPPEQPAHQPPFAQPWLPFTKSADRLSAVDPQTIFKNPKP